MELIYRINDKDKVIGPIDRDRAHAEEVLHRSGMVFLERSDKKILIQHRSPLKKTFPDCFDASSTFHVAFGETYRRAAKRELREETGVDAKVVYLGKFLHHDPPEHQMVAVFSSKSDDAIRLDRTEATSAEFLSRGEIDEIVAKREITPWLRDGWKLFSAKRPE